MADVFSQPPPQSTSSEDRDVLVQMLDHLLERYLQLLHQHQTLQRDLAERMSSGYFSLAQANFASPTRRYGPDFYDERMKASTLVSIDASVAAFSIATATHRSHSPLPEEGISDGSRSPSLDVADGVVENEKTLAPRGNAVVPTSDPLKWFGILIPPALRSAQKGFQRAVVDVVPALASVMHEMKEVEDEVRKTRERMQITP